jgi:hypothetical protein
MRPGLLSPCPFGFKRFLSRTDGGASSGQQAPGRAEDLARGEPDGDVRRHREVVQRAVVDGGDDGGHRQRRAEVLQQGAGRIPVETLGRLVEQQQAGAAQVGLGDREPAPLPAGQALAAGTERRRGGERRRPGRPRPARPAAPLPGRRAAPGGTERPARWFRRAAARRRVPGPPRGLRPPAARRSRTWSGSAARRRPGPRPGAGEHRARPRWPARPRGHRHRPGR